MLAAAAASAAWLVAAAALLVSRMPPQPPVGPRTLELGPEPPAVANFLTHGWRVTDDAVPATLIDLAARDVVDIEQRGPPASSTCGSGRRATSRRRATSGASSTISARARTTAWFRLRR